MLKSRISSLVRSLGLLHATDYLRFIFFKLKNHGKNKRFRKNHPGLILPPDYMVYESFQLDYEKYYTDSIETTKWLASLFHKHISVYNINILDWGCGPARIARHLPDVIGNACFYYGTDYNPATIQWCHENIKGVHFSVNKIEPPLDYNPSFFHIIYGISIFTHLSEPMHIAWHNELQRILSPGGIIIITTQGNSFRVKLKDNERKQFDKGELVVRGNVKEGHRTFSAFQPEAYMKKLFDDFSLLEFIPGDINSSRPQQDTWIFRK